MGARKARYKIIGDGAVAQGFLASAKTRFSDVPFEVYGPRDVATFRSEEGDVTFLCCSVDEARLLRRSSRSQSRLSVARANLRIVSSLAEKGAFRAGTVLVLTNPSDLIAEFLSENASNPRVFALGLSVDRRRYVRIFESLGVPPRLSSCFTLSGNHWDRPIPLFEESSELRERLMARLSVRSEERFLDVLHAKLQTEVLSEFTGFRPPVQSGIQAMVDAVTALERGEPLLVSGKAPGLRNFMAGSLHGAFTPHLALSGAAEHALSQTSRLHRLALQELKS